MPHYIATVKGTIAPEPNTEPNPFEVELSVDAISERAAKRLVELDLNAQFINPFKFQFPSATATYTITLTPEPPP